MMQTAIEGRTAEATVHRRCLLVVMPLAQTLQPPIVVRVMHTSGHELHPRRIMVDDRSSSRTTSHRTARVTTKIRGPDATPRRRCVVGISPAMPIPATPSCSGPALRAREPRPDEHLEARAAGTRRPNHQARPPSESKAHNVYHIAAGHVKDHDARRFLRFASSVWRSNIATCVALSRMPRPRQSRTLAGGRRLYCTWKPAQKSHSVPPSRRISRLP